MEKYVEYLPLTGQSIILPVEERTPNAVPALEDERIFGFRFFDGDGEIRDGGFVGKQENFSCRYLYGHKGCVNTLEDIIRHMGRANTLVERMEILGHKATFSVGNTHICMELSDQVI